MSLPAPDRTIVINLARRADRLADFRRSWEASGWAAVLGEPQVFVGVDGTAAVRPELPYSLTAGAYGCWASHLAVLQAAYDDGVQLLAVFEDDAVLPVDSAAYLATLLQRLPDEAIGLWLDAEMPGERNRLIGTSRGAVHLLHPPLRTHAYLMTRSLIEQLLPVVATIPAHIDRLYAYTPISGNVYAAVPSLAAQSSSPSDTLSNWAAAYGAQRSKR